MNDVTGQDGKDDEQKDEGEYDDVDVLVEYLDKRFGSRCQRERENTTGFNTTQNGRDEIFLGLTYKLVDSGECWRWRQWCFRHPPPPAQKRRC